MSEIQRISILGVERISVTKLVEPVQITLPRPDEMGPFRELEHKSIIVKDQSGKAAYFPIYVLSGDGVPIEGKSVITSNFGYLTLYTDGFIWTDSLDCILDRIVKRARDHEIKELDES